MIACRWLSGTPSRSIHVAPVCRSWYIVTDGSASGMAAGPPARAASNRSRLALSDLRPPEATAHHRLGSGALCRDHLGDQRTPACEEESPLFGQ